MTRYAVRERRLGISYVDLLFGLVISISLLVSLSMAWTHGMRMMRATEIRTELLNLAQGEMERVRGRPYGELESARIRAGEAVGEVTIERLEGRHARVTVKFARADDPGAPVTLVTEVYPHGIR
ncbi:MAG TPA: hypothetical protein VGB20_05395 [bacterium]